MAEISLPLTRFSAETYLKSLQGLVDRYEHEGEPIHYKKAATEVSETTCSSCLKYFSDIGLIDAEKQGVYTPSEGIIGYITKVREAKENAVQQIKSTLHNDPIFEEVLFHVDEDGTELGELAERTASGLEIKKDDIPNIERAIEIFAELDLLDIDEDEVVTLPSDEGSTTSGLTAEGKTQDDDQDFNEASKIRDPTQIQPNNLDLPPTKGDPENLHQLCSLFKTGGKWSIDNIVEESEFAKRTAQGQVRYGLELGFVEKSQEIYSPTQRGYNLGFESGLNENTEEMFLSGVLESDVYVSLLSRCLKLIVDEGYLAINSSDCERELRTYFGFTEESERTLRDAITTFLKTIEATGYGNYITGRKGKETRVELSQNELDSLQSILHNAAGKRPESVHQVQEDIDENVETDEADSDRGYNGEATEVGPLLKPKLGEGPPLRISSFRIQNFRNIQDTGEIRLEPITTFIGMNETGKTSTLEAINTFSNDDEIPDRDICNDIDYQAKDDLPIVSLTFEITEEIARKYYDEVDMPVELPLEYQMTKYADGHIETETEFDIPPPSPEIVYYNEYDLISDELYFDEDEDPEKSTFWSLLKIGGLTEEEVTQTTGRAHDQAIETAENNIEDRLNQGWSQKDIQVKLSYSDKENCLRIYIQDEIADEERELTLPSQRSEGFQWFFSFYVNMLMETEEDSDGHKILLLDDPAVHLHPSGKQDWLKSLEEIAKEEQVLYTSHSPYLIEKQFPSRIRTVEDSPTGTQINADIFDADTGTLEPLRNALGMDFSSSPFVSEGQLLVEGPSEYYILSAVGTYMDDVLDREFIDWNKISLMPVRGADDVIGKASWLESENLEYVILLDSDEQGQGVEERIQEHYRHIDDDRVQLLSRRPHDEDVVIEDLFDPEFYVSTVNEYYSKLTSNYSNDFETISVSNSGPNKWEIGREEYDGQRIDEILVKELERQDIAVEIENDEGEIELAKRPIAERLSEKINEGKVDPEDLDYFNEVLGNVNAKLNF